MGRNSAFQQGKLALSYRLDGSLTEAQTAFDKLPDSWNEKIVNAYLTEAQSQLSQGYKTADSNILPSYASSAKGYIEGAKRYAGDNASLWNSIASAEAPQLMEGGNSPYRLPVHVSYNGTRYSNKKYDYCAIEANLLGAKEIRFSLNHEIIGKPFPYSFYQREEDLAVHFLDQPGYNEILFHKAQP